MIAQDLIGAINGFKGEYRFLSNFYPCPIEFEGRMYPTSEHAYQAAKTTEDAFRALIAELSTGAAKRHGRALAMREDWEAVKVPIMLRLLQKKFRDPILKAALLQTGERYLCESNYWHDNFWGNCDCNTCLNTGQNMLGVLLMQVRKELA